MRRRFWPRRCLMTLRGKTALVTGGSRGIGRGIALKLADSGAKVAVHYYQKEDQAKATLEKLRALGSDGFLVQADVCKAEEIRRKSRRYKPTLIDARRRTRRTVSKEGFASGTRQ